MSQIINELATIEVSNELVRDLDLGGIYKSFTESYRKLDDLKNFRSEYEKKNFLARWWQKGKLRDAQLDSAEVQAEFSKTIGQLMTISIMQSKSLSEQQAQLNNQQGDLKIQADGIENHARELKKQHQVLADQSQKLEKLVHEYFALKGLTEEGAQKLIEIANEVKSTKNKMLEEFAIRAEAVEAISTDLQSRMVKVSEHVDARIREALDQAQTRIEGVQVETQKSLIIHEENQRLQLEAAQKTMNQGMEKLAQNLREVAGELQVKQITLEACISGLSEKNEQRFDTHQKKFDSIDGTVGGLSGRSSELAAAIAKTNAELGNVAEQQRAHRGVTEVFQRDVSSSLGRFRYATVGLSVVVLGLVGGMVYLMKWI